MGFDKEYMGSDKEYMGSPFKIRISVNLAKTVHCTVEQNFSLPLHINIFNVYNHHYKSINAMWIKYIFTWK